jgi:peptidyl-prolyl cis-trans isomerase SurA
MVRAFIALLALCLAAPFAPATAQTTIVAVVNGEPITSYDLEQRQRLLRLTGAPGNRRERALDELINEKVQMQAAKKASVSVPDSQIDQALGELAKRVNLSPGQLRQALGQQGVDVGTLRDRLEAQIAFNRLIRARFQKVIDISEPELVAALLEDEDRARKIETPEYELEQVIIALPEEPSDSRLRRARSRAKALRGEFRSCEEGLRKARETRNVVVRPFGRRTAAELTADARQALEGVAVGRLSTPVRTPRGLVMFAVCDKKMIQSTNAAMKQLEPDMRQERGQAFSKQYLRQLRRDAVIERR